MFRKGGGGKTYSDDIRHIRSSKADICEDRDHHMLHHITPKLSIYKHEEKEKDKMTHLLLIPGSRIQRTFPPKNLESFSRQDASHKKSDWVGDQLGKCDAVEEYKRYEE